VFLVTRIGCGIAGFRDEEMAPLFADALGIDHIALPRSFVRILEDTLPRPLTTLFPSTLTADSQTDIHT
jgi:hypothetical protein